MPISTTGELRISRTALERLLRLPGGLVHRNIARRTERVAQTARRLAPGRMGDQIRTRVEGRGRDVVGIVSSHHAATVFVVHGTRPHVIRPVERTVLRFTVGGQVVYARVVHHPGTRPNPFLLEALRSAR